jgi:hypothetical protein
MQWVEPGAVRAYLLLMVEHSWVTVTVTAWRIVNLECAGLACAGRTGTEMRRLSSRDCCLLQRPTLLDGIRYGRVPVMHGATVT